MCSKSLWKNLASPLFLGGGAKAGAMGASSLLFDGKKKKKPGKASPRGMGRASRGMGRAEERSLLR